MEKNYYNVGSIYGVYTAWDEWDSRDHWDMCVEDLENIGAVMISNERYGGMVGCDDTRKDWEDCTEDIDRIETEIDDLKSELTDTNNDQEDISLLTDELIERVEEHKDRREYFKRFKRIEGYHYDLLIDLVRYAELTGNHDPKDEHLRELLEEYSASGQGELETIRVVEIDQCPNWVEEIADLDFEECESLGGFKITTNYENIFKSKIVSFLMDQGLSLSKRHKIEEVTP